MHSTYSISENPQGNICIFIDWYLPGFKAGGPIQSVANMVAHLSKYKKFYIITRNTDYCETTPYENIEANTWTKIAQNVHVFYISSDQVNLKTMKALLTQNKFEKIYLNGIFSTWFTLIPLYVCNTLRFDHVIVGARGMLAPAALSIKKKKKQLFIHLTKYLRLFKRVSFHATNQEEANQISKIIGGKNRIYIAANLPKLKANQSFIGIAKQTDSLKLINVARIAPEKNLLYALECLMHVKSRVEFNFYGPIYDEEYWKRCQAQIQQLPSNVLASYKGPIDNSKVGIELAMHHVMFMPTQGENFGHIILESLQMGRPVIISDLTPWKNLNEKMCGYDLPLHSKTAFAEAIDAFAKMQNDEYESWCNKAYQFAIDFSKDGEDLENNKLLFSISN